MADVGQQHVNHYPLYPENAFSATGATWEAATPPVLQRVRSPPSPHWRRIQVTGPQDALFLPANAADNRRQNGHRDDVIPPIDNIRVVAHWQDQPQDPRYIDMADYNVARHRPPQPGDLAGPHGYHDRGTMDNYARVVQDVAAQPHAVALPAPGIDVFDYVAQHPAAGPAPAFLYERPHQYPIPNEPATEVLRQLASRYVNHPGAHVNMVRMEPCPAGGFRVVINLEMAYLL